MISFYLVGILRALHSIKAEKLQFSVWSSPNLKDLIQIALTIRKFGGKTAILEEKFIF